MLLILLMLLIFFDAGRWRTHILRISASAPIVWVRVVRISLIARICVARILLAIAAILSIVWLLSGRLVGILGRIVWCVRILRLGLDVSSGLIVVGVGRRRKIVRLWVLSSLLIRIVVLVGWLMSHRWRAIGIVSSIIVVVIIAAYH